MIHIFCYGSNLPKKRIFDRLGKVNYIGIAILSKYQLVFNKKSKDNSAKANIEFTNSDKDEVWGVVVQITEKQKIALDKFEKGYNEINIYAKLEGDNEIMAITYVADKKAGEVSLKPFDWYKALVIFGALEHQFPSNYITNVKNIESMPDTNDERSNKNWDIIKESLITHFI